MSSSSHPGRNDPCPCGSGKKYKRCCWVPGAASLPPAAPVNGSTWAGDTEEVIPTPDDPAFVPWMQAMIKHLPKSERREFEKMLAPILHAEKVAAASEKCSRLEQAQFMKQVGLDPLTLTDTSPEAVQQWIDEQLRDPAKSAAIEAALAKHPKITDITTARLQQLQDGLLDLLEHDPDAPLLTMDEMEPWLLELGDKLKQAAEPAKPRWWSRKPKPMTSEKFIKLVHDTTERMATALFTPKRIEQLRLELKDFGQTLAAAGDDEAVELVRDSFLLLPSDATPKNCDFLVNFGFRSIRAALMEMETYAQQNPNGPHEAHESMVS